ncbi:glutamyl-tRNA reductase [Opitutus sp. GAS368]|uniref:glutamyl-tRNA reductase n=1 Tax=Opitutus sp. GAS368 TaxID=1882749 RepID=UPI00087AD5CC|nr:glutamyl-tRNA reductase [Opitutus sp. GAS368]SDR70317.1 glutamyl-tRNA reductase [Opitutus sp. GAS368]
MEPTAPVLFLLGASHHTAPLAIREKLALDDARAAALATRLQATPGVREFALLNTCNRVEVYGVASAASVDRLAATVGAVTGCTAAELAGVLQARLGHNVVEHLFAVAAGLDSQVVGETEILGQMKAAYEAALARHWTGPVLNRVFQKSFQAAKHIRTHTAIGAGQVSIATVAVDLAGRIFGELGPSRVLVVGAGDIGLKTAQAFQSRGAAAITVASRTLSSAEAAAAQAGGWAASLAELPELLATADIVASSTSAPGFVLTAALVAAAMKHRPARPLFLIDLALPRDIDPAAAAQANVFLYNLDDLAAIAEENLAQREAEAAKGRAIVAERTAALWPQVAHSLNPPV